MSLQEQGAKASAAAVGGEFRYAFAVDDAGAVELLVYGVDDVGGVNLGGANLGGINLGGSNLGGSNLGGINLAGNNLVGTNLGGANLGGVNSGRNIHNLTGSINGMLYSAEDMWTPKTAQCIVMGLGSTAFAKLLGQQSAGAKISVATSVSRSWLLTKEATRWRVSRTTAAMASRL